MGDIVETKHHYGQSRQANFEYGEVIAVAGKGIRVRYSSRTGEQTMPMSKVTGHRKRRNRFTVKQQSILLAAYRDLR